jgi:hypothetical protein
MRTLTVLLIAISLLCNSAYADEGFVIDTRDADSHGKVYSFVNGELEVSDPHGGSPLLVLRFAGEQPAEIMLLSLHPGDVYTQPLERRSETGESEIYGVIQVREFGSHPQQPHRALEPQATELLKLGKRYVIGNVELVIYAPGSSEFRADILIPRESGDEYGSYRLPVLTDLSQPVQSDRMQVSDWISGSL